MIQTGSPTETKAVEEMMAAQQQQQQQEFKRKLSSSEEKVASLSPRGLEKEEETSSDSVKNNVSNISEAVRKKKDGVESEETDDEEMLAALKERPEENNEDLLHPHSLEAEQEEDQSNPLHALLHDLSPDSQAQLEDSLEARQKEIAGFQSVFSTNNRKYFAMKTQLQDPSIQQQYHQLKESEGRQHQELKTGFSKLEQLFIERIKILTDAIALHLFEAALLNETITGNDSYFKSYSVLNLTTGYRYGATYRLWELEEALKKRRTAVGIQVEEQQSLDNSQIVETNPSSETTEKLAKLSSAIDMLKEEVIICNEALKKQTSVVFTTELPRQYYIYHRQKLDALKTSLEELNAALEQQISQLKLNLESSTPDSDKAVACQREMVEIEKRKTLILHRQKEIEVLLSQRKQDFKLDEKGLDTKDPIQLGEFSPEYTLALDLIGRITARKEEIILSNNWEKFASIERRKFVYFEHEGVVKALKYEKTDFEVNSQVSRKKLIDAAVLAYQGYIINIQQSMDSIDSHFRILERDSLERAKWQVSPPPKIETAVVNENPSTGESSHIESTKIDVDEVNQDPLITEGNGSTKNEKKDCDEETTV